MLWCILHYYYHWKCHLIGNVCTKVAPAFSQNFLFYHYWMYLQHVIEDSINYHHFSTEVIRLVLVYIIKINVIHKTAEDI